ncbi:MAG TPA: hypothetical protein VF221_12630, partial [Chloroflexota bacterium]
MKTSVLGPTAFSVSDSLGPVRRRIGLGRVRAWAVRGLAAGASVAILLLVSAHLATVPWEPLPLGIAVIVLGALAGAGYGVGQWPDTLDAARAADRHFSLHDRLTTALEYRASADPFFGLQRADAGRRIDGLELAQSGRAALDLRETVLAGALLLAFAALLFVGGTSPGHTSAAAAGEGRRIHSAAVTRVPQITRKVEAGLTPATRQNPALRKLSLALARLRNQLEHTATRAAALRSISATQQQLHRLAASLHPVNKAAVAQLNSSLAHYMTAKQRAAATASDRKALAAAAKTLQQLGQKLAHMSAAQRAQLARSLTQAANSTADSRLQASLRQASSSLGYNDPQTAAQSLRQAASALAQTPAQQTAQSRLSAANGQLDSLKNAVSGVGSGNGQRNTSGATGSGTGKGAGSSGKGSASGSGGKGGSGQSGKGSSGKGSSNGKGSSGAGSGSGKGTGSGSGSGKAGSGGRGSGSGSGSGNGQGGTGGRGAGGGRGGAGNQGQGRYTTVYAPYKQGKGPKT